MRVAVIGAGISGLAFGKYAALNGIKVKLFESEKQIGGIAKVKLIDGCIPYHLVGGHCFNSKFDHVKEFVFKRVLEKKKWQQIDRVSHINFKNMSISYPIEYAIKEIFNFDCELALSMVRDYFCASKDDAQTLGDWFVNNFGKTLAKEYFIPYNKKIWNRDPFLMSSSWVADKLPMPNDLEVLRGLIDRGNDTMPHAKFHYPAVGGQETFINALADGLLIERGTEVSNIRENSNGTFSIGDEIFDYIVYTGPLNKLSKVIKINDDDVLKSESLLRYNKVTNVIWRSDPTNDTWTYYPEKHLIFHRVIHIGNFVGSKLNYSITEAIGEVSREKMISEGNALQFLQEPLDYNVSDYAYVVFDQNAKHAREKMFEYITGKNFFLLGRFAEWEYYNMDICIERAISLVEKILKSDCFANQRLS